MSNNEFKRISTQLVYNYVLGYYSKNEIEELGFTIDNVFTVWSCKTLQNHKALLSTDITDGKYYEITYNGDKREIYFDAYSKTSNICINMDNIDVIFQ